MKLLLGFLVSILLIGAMEVRAENWKVYEETSGETFSLDIDSIIVLPNKIVRVWRKIRFSEKAGMEFESEFGKIFKNLREVILLTEINCVDKKSRNLSATCYSKQGEVLAKFTEGDEWQSMIRDSIGEYICDCECK
jgi:hypothetical protein